jgi:hypothetical protein
LLLLMDVLLHYNNIYLIILRSISVVVFVYDCSLVKWGIRLMVLSQTRSIVHLIPSCDVLSVAVVEGLYLPEVEWKP